MEAVRGRVRSATPISAQRSGNVIFRSTDLRSAVLTPIIKAVWLERVPGAVFRPVASEAMDHGMKHVLFERSCHFGLLNQFACGARQVTGVLEQALKTDQVRAGRVESSGGARWQDRLASQCRSTICELIGGEGYQAPLAFTARSLMHPLAGAVKGDLAALKGKPIAFQAQPANWKGQKDPVGCKQNAGNARQPFAQPHDDEMVQFQPQQLRFEISGTGDREIDTGIAKSGFVGSGIVKP